MQLTASSPIILLSSILKWACRHPAKKRMLNAWIASHLNRLGTFIRIVFWEAKMIDDSRLRSRTDPKVVKQSDNLSEIFDRFGSGFEVSRMPIGRFAACY